MSMYAEEIKERYSYKDYLSWPEDERWELIDGEPVAMSPAPNRNHQSILGELHLIIGFFLKGKPCRVYLSPLDVRIDQEEGTPDEEVYTVLQPDLVVVCDKKKQDDMGIKGSPDLAIEILSKGTARRDQNVKFKIYEEAGVREYWIVDPWKRTITIHLLGGDGKYSAPVCYSEKMKVESRVLEGINFSAEEIFVEF